MLGEISRNDVGIPPEVNTDFNNEEQKECWGKSLDFLRSQ